MRTPPHMRTEGSRGNKGDIGEPSPDIRGMSQRCLTPVTHFAPRLGLRWG